MEVLWEPPLSTWLSLPALGRCFQAHQHQRQLNLRPLPCSSAHLSLPSSLSPVQSMEQVLEHTQEPTGGSSPSTCGHCPEPAQESTRTTHTQTPNPYIHGTFPGRST